MRLSTRTEYGIRLLFELAFNYGKGVIILKDIARKQNISEKYLSKIVLQLKGAGIINSARGAKGGYILAISPENINLNKVVEVLEGTPLIMDCINNKVNCNLKFDCPTFELWKGLLDVINQYLNSKTLKDLVVDYENKIKSYQEIYYI